MSTLAEIETAIQQLSPEEQAKLARWWQTNIDPGEGLELREEVAQELDAAQREIERREVGNWHQLNESWRLAGSLPIRPSQERSSPADRPPPPRRLSIECD